MALTDNPWMANPHLHPPVSAPVEVLAEPGARHAALLGQALHHSKGVHPVQPCAALLLDELKLVKLYREFRTVCESSTAECGGVSASPSFSTF